MGFIHESIWYDLGHFENWLIDHRDLNLGDVVPFRSCRLPGPTLPKSNESQATSTEEEEPFISVSLTISKAASLPENIAESGLVPSSAGATMGGELAVSMIEKLDAIEFFMASLTKEAIDKADALLKIRGDRFISTVTSDPVMNWLCSSSVEPPPSIMDIPHPLAPLSTSVVEDLLPNLECSIATGLIIKEEPSTPEFPTPAVPTALVDTTPTQTKPSDVSPTTKGCVEAVISSKRPQLLGPVGQQSLHANQSPKCGACLFCALLWKSL